jgi:hypothetical protein
MFDIVDRDRQLALAENRDAPLHVDGRQAGIGPHHESQLFASLLRARRFAYPYTYPYVTTAHGADPCCRREREAPVAAARISDIAGEVYSSRCLVNSG